MEDTTIEAVLKTVEALYQAKDYEKALKILKDSEGQVSPGLWHYNMGTIFAKLENLPLARYHFLMSDMKGFSAKEMITNKEIVEGKLEIERLEKPLSPSDYFVKFSLFGAQGVFTTLGLLFVLVGLFTFWKNKSVKALLVFVLLSFTFIGYNVWVGTWNKVIVVETQTIQDGPSAIFGQRGELPPGVMLVLKPKGDWFEITYPSRFQGWIKDNGLEELR